MSKQISRRQLLKSSAGIAGLLALTACGGGGETNAPASGSASASASGSASTSASGSASASAAASPSSSGAASPAAYNGGERIVYWDSFSGKNREASEALVNKFNTEQSDVYVEYQNQGNYEETAQKLTAALQARTTPEVSVLSDVWWFKFYLAKALQPLDDLYAGADIDTSDYVQALFTEGVRNGASYWVPFARSTPLFYYNKDIWAEAGLPDRGPETWDEFVEWTPKLVKKDGNTLTRAAFVHPSAAGYNAWLFQGMAWQFGGQYSDEFEMTMTDPNTVAAGQFYGDTVNKGGWAKFSPDEVKEFVSGGAAAAIMSTGSMGGLLRDAQFDLGTAFLPKKEQFGCCTGGAGMAILANLPEEKQQAAMRWIAFATSPENTTFWSKNTGYMPVRTSAVESAEMQQYFEENPTFRTAVEQLPLTKPQDAARVFVPGGDQIIGKGLEQIVVNKQDPQVAFEQVNSQLTQAAQPVVQALKQVEG